MEMRDTELHFHLLRTGKALVGREPGHYARDQGDVLSHPLDVSGGYLHLSERPGLGVDLVEDELARHPGIRELKEKENFYV
mgnify:CR=1 FL=1